MRYISFDAFRTLKLPNVHYIKPDQLYKQQERIKRAEWVLFPEYWQLGPLLFGLKSRIFPSPASYFLGHSKVEMSRAFEMITPANVPWTRIEENTIQNAQEIWDEMILPFVAKYPISSMGQGVFLIENRQQWEHYLARTPVIYVQEYLPITKDLRIIVIGNRVISAFWRTQGFDGFHNNLSQGGHVETKDIPPAALQLALKLARTLAINHAGFDIAMVGNHPYVFEFNRLFGNTGLPELHDQVATAILDYLRQHSGQDDPHDPLDPEPPLPMAV